MTIAKHAAIKASKFSTVPASLQASVAQTKAEYPQLGKSGLRVSNPILGGLQIGSPERLQWVLGEDKYGGDSMLTREHPPGTATAQGGLTHSFCLRRKWDTANVYSNGESERIMGKALRKYGIPRSKVVLLTKCGRVVCGPENLDVGSGVAAHSAEAARSKDYMNAWGLSRSSIFHAVAASLERLGTPYIDLLQIHRFDEQVPPEETMGALDHLVKAGKVRYIGASSMWAYQLALLQQAADKHGYAKFVSMQNHYNLLYREEEREMNRYCHETGVGLIPWAPLASGQLARPRDQNGASPRSTATQNGALYHDDDASASRAIVGHVQETARRRGWPMSHVALAWLNRRVAAPVVGLGSVARLDDVLGARGKVLTAEEEGYLDEQYRPRWVQGHM
ncbi:NADP-dependent oxidoreductase domain-containing protein [Apiospora marii]|uniref:NADP-dependent oxidoreductase domain-containing protein n=1 Tax=Apiospora marii TaxID=335849 RepID=A0ABR1SC16_9PEZI